MLLVLLSLLPAVGTRLAPEKPCKNDGGGGGVGFVFRRILVCLSPFHTPVSHFSISVVSIACLFAQVS